MPVTVNGLPLDAGPVFVLGAGFTRAVCPEALLENDFEVKWLLERFRSYRTARKLLELEAASDPGGTINLERLMTRLHGGMPYDASLRATEELSRGRVAQQ
jgi:hypothetical protein